MKSARSAGYMYLIGAFAYSPFAAAFWYLKGIFPKIIAIPCSILFYLLCFAIAICLFYAAWGLWLGYNPKAWNRYCEAEDKEIMKSIQKIKIGDK